jgi:hypothetical protein
MKFKGRIGFTSTGMGVLGDAIEIHINAASVRGGYNSPVLRAKLWVKDTERNRQLYQVDRRVTIDLQTGKLK